MTFLTSADELWNICNPRPYPKQEYHTVQWEELDFFMYKGEWILREFREKHLNINNSSSPISNYHVSFTSFLKTKI